MNTTSTRKKHVFKGETVEYSLTHDYNSAVTLTIKYLGKVYIYVGTAVKFKTPEGGPVDKETTTFLLDFLKTHNTDILVNCLLDIRLYGTRMKICDNDEKVLIHPKNFSYLCDLLAEGRYW